MGPEDRCLRVDGHVYPLITWAMKENEKGDSGATTSPKIMLLQRYRSHGVIRMMNRESHHRAMRKGMRLWFRLG